MNRKWIGVSLLVALLAVGIVSAFILADETNKEWKNHGCFDQLTEEQREAVKQKIQELKDAGASHEEIKEAMQQFMEELGINMEDCGMRGHGQKGFGQKGFGQNGMGNCHDQLTEEQREAVKQKIQELKDAGATPEEIKEAMQQFMEELGVNIEDCGMKGFEQKDRGGCFDQLTEEQREAAMQKIQELKDAGATPEEIKEAMQQFMEELGINMEDCGMKGHGTESEGGS